MREEGRRGERLEEAGEHTEGGGQGAFVSPPHTFTPSFRRKSAHCTPYLRLEMGIGRRLELFEDGSDFEERQTDVIVGFLRACVGWKVIGEEGGDDEEGEGKDET